MVGVVVPVVRERRGIHPRRTAKKKMALATGGGGGGGVQGAHVAAVPALALGVITAPDAHKRRSGARATWLRDPAVLTGRVAVRFVLGGGGARSASDDGDAACRESVRAEAAAHPADTLLVDARDCHIWHSPAKVHAWFKAALRLFPSTAWLGKTEDDALPWPSAVVADLETLSPRVQYYGLMAWQGSCRGGWRTATATATATAAQRRRRRQRKRRRRRKRRRTCWRRTGIRRPSSAWGASVGSSPVGHPCAARQRAATRPPAAAAASSAAPTPSAWRRSRWGPSRYARAPSSRRSRRARTPTPTLRG